MINPNDYAKRVDQVEQLSRENHTLRARAERAEAAWEAIGKEIHEIVMDILADSRFLPDEDTWTLEVSKENVERLCEHALCDGQVLADALEHGDWSGRTRREDRIQAERDAALEKVAQWAIECSFATGHADDLDNLLAELGHQVNAIRDKRDAVLRE